MNLKLNYGDVNKAKAAVLLDPCTKLFHIETSKYGEHLSIQDARAIMDKFQTWIDVIAASKPEADIE